MRLSVIDTPPQVGDILYRYNPFVSEEDILKYPVLHQTFEVVSGGQPGGVMLVKREDGTEKWAKVFGEYYYKYPDGVRSAISQTAL